MSISDKFFDKLQLTAWVDELKETPGFPEEDAEVDQAVVEMKGELVELGLKCSFDLSDEATLQDWINSKKVR